MGAGISARYVRTLTAKSTGRISARFGASGVELEVGASRRMSHSTTAGLYVSVGLAVNVFSICIQALVHLKLSRKFGASRRLSHSTTAGLYVSVGLVVSRVCRLSEAALQALHGSRLSHSATAGLHVRVGWR